MGMESYNPSRIANPTTAHTSSATPKGGPSEANHLVLRGLPTHAPPAPVCQNAGAGFDPSRWPVTVDPDTGCWLWQGSIGTGGYGRVWNTQTQALQLAHRHVYESEVDPIPEGLFPDHLCRVHACVNPAHIQLVTRGQNCRRGKNAKLTWTDVAEIRRLVADGVKQKTVAELFGTTPGNVCLIMSGRRWAVESHEQAYGGGWEPPLESELAALGTVPIPSALLARTWLSILGELSTPHPAEGDSPVSPCGGITGHSSLLLPNGPRCAPIRAAGSRRGASHA